jgi:oxygen-independent coproporphyrinogen-3 oxidase
MYLVSPVARAVDPNAPVPISLDRKSRAADPASGQFDAARPLGIYVHFPFCGVHCPYCDFAVDERADIPHDEYADAVVREIDARAPWFGAAGASDAAAGDLRSIYFGGGTPGLWRPAALGRVIAGVERHFPRNDPAVAREITVEVNPGEVDEAHLRALADAGVNRLSMGAQSFDDEELRRLGRNHDAEAIPRAFHAARTVGFTNLTVDLMFAIPGQSLASWQRSLAALIALGPEHVSAYSLTIERGTRFFNDDKAGRLERPDDDVAAEMFRCGQATLAGAGYAQYEISSHARPGFRAVHNQLYWTQGAYLGVGASAASFRPLVDGTGWRFSNPRATATYLRAAAAADGPRAAKVERRAADDLENEALWLALRTSDGVDRRAHQRRFGADPLAGEERATAAARFARSGWLLVSDDVVRLSPEGILFADEIAAQLWRAGA